MAGRCRSVGRVRRGLATLAACLGLLAGAPRADELSDPLTLEQALRLADLTHPELTRADAQVAAARAEQARADAGDNARVDLELAARLVEPSPAARTSEPSSNDSWAKLRISKPLYDFGRTERLTAAADAELRGRELDLLDVRQQRRLQVMARYFDVLLADLGQARDNETMAIAYVRLDRMRARHHLGQVADLTLLELESRYQELLRRQRTSQAQQRATRSRLALALNRPDQLPANLEYPAPPAARALGEVEDLVTLALSDNPRLRALRAGVAAADQRAAATLAGNGAVLRGELEAAAYQRSLGSSDPFTAALVLAIPLSSGGALEAEVAQRHAQTRERQAELALQELKLRQSVLDLWLELQTLEARRQELEALGAFRELDLDRSRTLYELEYTSDLGDAMARIAELRLLKAENQYRITLVWARLDALTGRLLGGGGPGTHSEDRTP